MRFEIVENSKEVIMPARIVLITSGIFSALLILSELCLFYWHFKSGMPLTSAQITITAMITSAVALPAIGFFVYRSEDALANLRRLERISCLDTLTGILNRRYFDERVNGLISKARANESAGTFLFLDIDHFKTINDELGHSVGDKVLSTVGTSLIAATLPNDVLGRIGGDEFGVFLPETNAENAVTVAERLQRTIAQNCHTLELGDKDLSVSIGVAEHRPGSSLAECIRSADHQLYAAKKGGRDRICAPTLKTVA
ncbi:MAG: GGDEF domain-containing protein [Pseudomonadota bacterium]